MKRILLAATFVTAIAAGGVVAAQAPAAKPAAPAPVPKAEDHAAHHPAAPAAPAAVPSRAQAGDTKVGKGTGAPSDGMMCSQMCGQMMGGGMGGGMMGGHGHGHGQMMGGGMMGGGMMGHMMMGGASTKVDVKKIDKGVTITLTSTDPAAVTRLQKMAEAMRLMHEATAQ